MLVIFLLCRKMKKQTQAKSIKGPNLETFERILKLGSLITQRLSGSNSSPLLQLPHVNEDDFKHFTTKKRRVVSLDDLAALSLEERRRLLRRLSENEYDDVIAVISGMPKVEMQAELEIIDIKDNTRVTPGALVTVNIYLQRRNILSNIHSEDSKDGSGLFIGDAANINSISDSDITCSMNRFEEKVTNNSHKKGKKNKNSRNEKRILQSSAHKRPSLPLKQANTNYTNKGYCTLIDTDSVDEDKEFELLQKTILKKDKLKSSSRSEICSLPVHCPHFPGNRQEGWWLYMSDPKTKKLTAAPKFIYSLLNTFETELKFQAPLRIGHYQYEVSLVSDSYIGLNHKESCSFTVYSPHTKQEEFDYGLDELDKENDNDIIEQEETTSTDGSDSHDSGVEN